MNFSVENVKWRADLRKNGKLKQNQRLFSLLNEKECEKEFKGYLIKKN